MYVDVSGSVLVKCMFVICVYVLCLPVWLAGSLSLFACLNIYFRGRCMYKSCGNMFVC